MRRIAALEALCIVFLMAGPVSGVEPAQLSGIWVGEWHGFEMKWQLDGKNRLRIDDRPGSFEIRSDSLIVHFDALDPEQPDQTETAIYRFLASHPSQVPAQLFIYGFDLGNGVSLERVEPPMEERVPATAAVAEAERHARNAGAPGPVVGEATAKKSDH